MTSPTLPANTITVQRRLVTLLLHGAAPITQYMVASTQFNPLSQQIIIYVRAINIRIDVIRIVRSIIIQYRDQPPLITVYQLLVPKTTKGMAQCITPVVTTFAFLLFNVCSPAASQECSLPDGGVINTNLLSLLIAVGGEGTATTTTLLDHHFTCLAVGSSRDQYREVSVAVRYTKSTTSGQFNAQFTLRCTSGSLATIGELDQSPPANVFNISTRRDCFICTTVNSQPGFTIDTTADCACELVMKHTAEIIHKLFSTSCSM